MRWFLLAEWSKPLILQPAAQQRLQMVADSAWDWGWGLGWVSVWDWVLVLVLVLAWA
jgi:hypothetical protein